MRRGRAGRRGQGAPGVERRNVRDRQLQAEGRRGVLSPASPSLFGSGSWTYCEMSGNDHDAIQAFLETSIADCSKPTSLSGHSPHYRLAEDAEIDTSRWQFGWLEAI
jgi:hypothetical protein